VKLLRIGMRIILRGSWGLMGEAKYISVIHTITNKLVTAFKLENDATWIGKEKDELIATANYCEPGQKIKMIFVKSYKRNDDKFIHPYFRSAPNQAKLKNNMSGESNEHKISKQKIYDGIYSGEIKINGEPINKEKVDDIYIEYRTARTGYVIPDVLIKFKEEDIKYGLGIFIEIQLSKQYEEETLVRTYSRVVDGFSGIWIWKDDLDKEYNLIDRDLKIKSHRQLLSELDKEIENKFIERINKYGNIIDKKLANFRKEIWNYFDSCYKSFQMESKRFSQNEINKLEVENKKLEELRELSEQLDLNSWKKSSIDFEEFTENMLNNGKIKLENSLKNLIKEQVNKLEQKCPKCNKPMKIGKAMSGYNWYCEDFPLRCDGLIKEVGFNES